MKQTGENTMTAFDQELFDKAIIPSLEIGSYEALWDEPKMWFKDMAKKFSVNVLPSELVHDQQIAEQYFAKVQNYIKKAGIKNFGVKFRGTGDYPSSLEDAADPLELLYFAGNWDLVYSPCVSIVGTRKPSDEGIKRAIKLARGCVERGYTIVSGLAEGIDTAAHETALKCEGKTIAVIGTPLDTVYPKKNSELFHKIANEQLVISQVPFVRYHKQGYEFNRYFFPERNKTMSALSQATIIVEAGQTSGTLVQARAALHQGRKLFILASCFDKGLTWPEQFKLKGAIKVESFEDIWTNL